MRRAFKTGSTKFRGPPPWYRRAARCWFSSFADGEQHPEQFMKNDSENGTGVPAPLVSRRTFMLAAAATSGAGILSAGLVPMSADRSAMKIDRRRSQMESPIEVVRRF